MAVVCDVLILLAVASFVPIYLMLESAWSWLALLPSFLVLKSVFPTWNGRWQRPGRAERGAVAGFIGMLLIPVALGVAFLAAAVTGR